MILFLLLSLALIGIPMTVEVVRSPRKNILTNTSAQLHEARNEVRETIARPLMADLNGELEIIFDRILIELIDTIGMREWQTQLLRWAFRVVRTALMWLLNLV